MDFLPNTSPSPEPTIKSQATPLLPQAKSPEVVSESGDRRLSRLGPRQPEPEQLPCPRCDSTNTKFCYYNNYNLSQPRHFCKSCRRYWTRGGALRNVPVGGGTRKASSSNKRHRIATTITPATATASNSNNLVSCSSDNDVMGQSKAVEPVVSNPVPGLGFGSIQVAAVNLNEAAVAKSGSSSCWWSSAQTGSGGGLLPFINGYGIGLGPVVGYEQGGLDWPMKQVSGGDSSGVVVSGESPGWQLMGGDADQGGVAEADYFSWPHLAISTTAKALK